MNPAFPLRSPIVCLALVAGVAAQSRPVPAHADLADGQHFAGLPFGAPGFRTQILVDAAAVAPTGVVVLGLRFRADRSSAPSRA